VYICAVKHSEIRQNIIKTASDLFYRNGYNSTGINEIIAKSGIAKATLYSHFKSKEDICKEYIQYKNSAFIEKLSTYCQSKEKGKAQILGVFDFLQKFYDSKNFNGCWCTKTMAEIPMDNEKIRKEIQQQKGNLISLITQLVIDNLKDIKKDKTISIARKIYLAYEAAVIESHLHQKDWPIKEAKEICSQIIL